MVNDHLKLNSLIKQILSTYHLGQCMNISLENLDVDIYRVNIKKITDHYTFLENCIPTPPLSQGGVGGQFPRNV